MRPFPTPFPLRIPNQGRVEEPEHAKDNESMMELDGNSAEDGASCSRGEGRVSEDSHGNSVPKEDGDSRPELGLDDLPSEILLQIIEDIATDAPPSLKKFTLEPSTLIELAKGDEEHPTLKALSCVSERFRALTLPFLFQFVKLRLEPFSRWAKCDEKLLQLLDKYHEHLNPYERCVWERLQSLDQSPPGLSYIPPPQGFHIPVHIRDTYLALANQDKVPGALNFMRQLPNNFPAFADFVDRSDLRRKIQGLTVVADYQVGDQIGRPICMCSGRGEVLLCVAKYLWLQLFNVLDPLRVVVAAPPTTMGVLTHACGQTEDQWAFDMKMHHFEVRMSDPSLDMRSYFHRVRNKDLQEPNENWNGTLLDYKRWTHLAYNEGASIPVYHTYEYHLKESPKHLAHALLTLSDMLGPFPNTNNLQSFHFVGIFPLAGDFVRLVHVMIRIPTLRSITVQLAPGPEQDPAVTAQRIGTCQPQSLWLEWEQCYNNLLDFLIRDTFEDGTVFSAVDCWDPRMEKEINEWVCERIRRRRTGWVRVAKGVWIRDSKANPLPSYPGSDWDNGLP